MRAGNVFKVGIYAIQLCDWIFELPPKEVTATGQLDDHGAEVTMVAKLNYGEGVDANIFTSALDTLRNRAVIVGTHGQITVIPGSIHILFILFFRFSKIILILFLK